MLKNFQNIFLFVILSFQWQCSIENKNDSRIYEEYINNLRIENVSLIKEIDKNCINLVLEAKKESDKWDKENPFSENKFRNAIKISKENHNKTLEIWSKYQYTSYLYKYRNMPKSIPLIVDLQNLLETNPSIITPAETYKFMGFYNSTINQNKEAIYFLEKSLEKIDEKDKASIYDNIGIILIKLKKFSKAIENFEKAKLYSVKYNDQIRLAKIYGNLSQIYLEEKKYDKAAELLLKDIEISRVENATQNTMFALIRLSNVYIEDQQIEKAKVNLEEADKIAKSKSYFKSSELEVVELQKKIAENTKNNQQELYFRKKIDTLELELKATDNPETITESQYTAQIAAINLQNEKEKAKVIETDLKNNILILILFFLIITSILLFINIGRKLKIKKTEHKNLLLSSEIEKINSENKLKNAHHSLESYKDYLNEKNTQINKLHSQISILEKGTSIQKNEKLKDLQKLLESHLMTDENWYKFKDAFISAYPTYFDYLQKNYDELTESNLRLIILLKLELSTKEIINLLGISADAIKKAKQRLKKKLGDKYERIFEIKTEKD